MTDRYTAVMIQYERITQNEMLDDEKRKQANVEKLCKSFDKLSAWNELIPAKLMVFPENLLSHGGRNLTQIQKVESSVMVPGPETDRIAEKAKEWNVYVSGSFHEKDPEFPEYYFNAAFIINPQGKLILKYRKINPWIPSELSTSPHDILDKYHDPLFPVVKTEIGNLGCYVCFDQFFPEPARQLAYNGAEILLKPTIFPPSPLELIHDPYDWYMIVNRMRSIENMVYGVNCNGAQWGKSMIVDYMGRVMAEASKGREEAIGAVIDVDELREYRKKAKLHNLLQQLRTECYTYLDNEVWPANKPLLRKEDYPEWAPKHIYDY